jgi:hypothetical protein
LRQLISLDLSETWISDAGLKHLRAIGSLEVLDLSETEATPQGVEALRDSLPGCVITYRLGLVGKVDGRPCAFARSRRATSHLPLLDRRRKSVYSIWLCSLNV